MRILEAVRSGLIPRVTRRLNSDERRMITSGSVYVWDDSYIERWTDSIQWESSHTLGNFRLYYPKNDTNHPSRTIDSRVTVDEHNLSGEPDHPLADIAARLKRERILLDSLPNSYNYKADRLIKKVCRPT